MDSATTTPPLKRRPGRPRKHPVPDVATSSAPATLPPEKRPRNASLTAEQKLWRRYLANRDNLVARNDLAELYIPQVRRAAERLMAVRQKMVTVDEVVGLGVEGLLQALAGYDPDRGITFMAYASPRIMGSMLDGLRNIDEVPRLDRRKISHVLAITDELQQQLRHRPTVDDVLVVVQSRGLDIHATVIDRALNGTANNKQLHAAQPANQIEQYDITRPADMSDSLVDRKVRRPCRGLRESAVLDRVFAGLNYDERVLLYLYHICGKTMKFTGEALDLSESRVSQLHSRLIERLKQKHRPEELFGLLRE